eukprot:GHVS01062608.1.p1 GENE.GHVS01062608.1~~GHVS01062608.1.p1  ORF type:complete len:523 (-),score=104.08 GHVS01062608.1:107-1675(-)
MVGSPGPALCQSSPSSSSSSSCRRRCSLLTSFALLLLSAFLPLHGDAAPRISTSVLHRSADMDTAATLKNGLQLTAGAGSVKDPDILELASVQELAAMDPELSSINKLMEDLGATFYLEQSRDITMFMPTNKAFRTADIDIDSLPWSAKWQLFQYHVVPQIVVKLDDIAEGGVKEFLSWEGSPLTVTAGGPGRRNKYKVNGNVDIVGNPPGIENFNGISYKVDRLLLPPTLDNASLLIEDHQSRGITRGATTTAEATDAVPSHPRLSSSSSPAAAEDNSEDVRGRFVGRLESTSNVVTGQNAPQFVQDINSAHSRWNDTPEERRERRNEGRGGAQNDRIQNDGTSEAVGLLGGGGGFRGGGVSGGLAVVDEEEQRDVGFIPTQTEIARGDHRSSASAIKVLGLDSEAVFVTMQPLPASVELRGSEVPDTFGWAGTVPGWSNTLPGQVSPAATNSGQEEGVGITAYLSREEDEGNSRSSEAGAGGGSSEEDSLFGGGWRERNRERRFRARRERLGVEVSSAEA